MQAGPRLALLASLPHTQLTPFPEELYVPATPHYGGYQQITGRYNNQFNQNRLTSISDPIVFETCTHSEILAFLVQQTTASSVVTDGSGQSQRGANRPRSWAGRTHSSFLDDIRILLTELLGPALGDPNTKVLGVLGMLGSERLAG